MLRWFEISVVAFMLLMVSCTEKASFNSPPHYDLNDPEKFFIAEGLTEISGITFNNGNPDTMYAIQDELGRLYYFKPGIKSADYYFFGKSGDYEDVAILKGRVIILKSNGTLVMFPLDAIHSEGDPAISTWKDLVPKGEYESLFADAETGNIYVLCKDCGGKNKKASGTVSGYLVQLTGSDSLTAAGDFSVNTSSLHLKEKKGKGSKPLRPSGMAKNPLTGEWFILASMNKLLVIVDDNWNITSSYKLSPAIFRQPEGIAFDKAGNLYISNEGDDISVANLLKFAYMAAGPEKK